MSVRVEVLMSTYNGAKYVEQQIDSIMAQVNVDVHLSVRDDGSLDDTVAHIQAMMEKYPGKISLHASDNLGYRKSFLKLIELAEEADYYAFSDQDDIWKPEKLSAAVSCLEEMDSDVKLYASSVEIVNEGMEHIGFNDLSTQGGTIESFFTRARLAGCCYVFNRGLKELTQRFADIDLPGETMPAHDFVVGSCAYSCGQVHVDKDSYIYHIRRSSSVTSGGNGLVKRLRTEYKIVFKRKGVHRAMAKLLLERAGDKLLPEAKAYLENVRDYKTNLKLRIGLLCNKRMTSQIPVCDLEQRLRILLGNF